MVLCSLYILLYFLLFKSYFHLSGSQFSIDAFIDWNTFFSYIWQFYQLLASNNTDILLAPMQNWNQKKRIEK